jgi:large subunit ribosomal protein L33
MARKSNRIIVKLQNKETGEYYTTTKNPKSLNTQGKLEFRKYDKKLRKHVKFSEAKMPK